MIRPRSKPRRGRDKVPEYLEWLAMQACFVTGRWPVTLHHVRRNGEPKKDRRALPLVAELHLIQHDPKQTKSIEALGKRKFEARWGVSLEAQIVRHNEMYAESVTGRSGSSGTVGARS